MWWLYLHSIQISLLWAGFSFMPHYTVAFKPFFEFIVLGAIPGTTFEIGYMTSLTIALVVFVLLLLRKQIVAKASKLTVHHQNQVRA